MSADPANEGRPTAKDNVRRRLTALFTAAAPYLVAIDGAILILLGVFALSGSMSAFQGEAPLLAIGGVALVLFGLMMIVRWHLSAVKMGLLGLTAGYFATALTEFETVTDPCDIGATIAQCANDVVVGAPWAVYQGPVVLAVLLFVLMALERFLKVSDE